MTVEEDDPEQETPEEETTAGFNEGEETSPTTEKELLPDKYPSREYQHTTAAFKGKYRDKWEEFEQLRKDLELESINQIPELKQCPEWIKADAFFHKDDVKTRAAQKLWRLRNPKLWEIRQEESKKKNEERKKNGKKPKKRSKKSKSKDERSSTSDGDEHDDIVSRITKKHRVSDKELHRFDRINDTKHQAAMQMMSAFFTAMSNIERESYLGEEP